MRTGLIDNETVRLGHTIKFDIGKRDTKSGRGAVSVKVTQSDVDGTVLLNREGKLHYTAGPSEDESVLWVILNELPRHGSQAPDGSRLFASEIRRDGSLVEGVENVQKIWRGKAEQWTVSATDLRAIRALSSISFVAR